MSRATAAKFDVSTAKSQSESSSCVPRERDPANSTRATAEWAATNRLANVTWIPAVSALLLLSTRAAARPAGAALLLAREGESDGLGGSVLSRPHALPLSRLCIAFTPASRVALPLVLQGDSPVARGNRPRPVVRRSPIGLPPSVRWRTSCSGAAPGPLLPLSRLSSREARLE